MTFFVFFDGRRTGSPVLLAPVLNVDTVGLDQYVEVSLVVAVIAPHKILENTETNRLNPFSRHKHNRARIKKTNQAPHDGAPDHTTLSQFPIASTSQNTR
jgi:hypothetical protein